MPSNQEKTTKKTPPRSLISVSEIRDVFLVEMHASAPDQGNYETLHINLQIGERKFRSTPGTLQVGLTARVLYFATEQEIPAEGGPLPTDDAVGSIVLDYMVDLDLDEDVDASEINDESIGKLVESTLNFVLFPYIRAAVQRITGEMPFPHTVIPFMRRQI